MSEIDLDELEQLITEGFRSQIRDGSGDFKLPPGYFVTLYKAIFDEQTGAELAAKNHWGTQKAPSTEPRSPQG